MKNYKKAVDRMIKRGELILDRKEDGKKFYKRAQVSNKNDFLINGVLASTLPKSEVMDVLDNWYAEGNDNTEYID